jgi:hypothetical protein
VAAAETADSIAGFAAANALAFAPRAELPAQGGTLSRPGGRVEAAATGALPGGIEGTLAHFTYTHSYTDSDNHTQTEVRRFTLVVTRIPESIGFLPYLGFAGSESKLDPRAGGEKMAPIDLGDREGFKGARAYAYAGTSESWLAQLLSPALVEWLARSDENFGFELTDGVLCAGRDGYLNDAATLKTICEDAARLAGALREESLEEVGTGGGAVDAARDPHANDPRMEAALARVQTGSPADALAARGAFSSYLLRSPATIGGSLRFAVALTVVLNVPGVALPITLIGEGLYGPLAVIEIALIAIVFFFSFRSRIRKNSASYAAEAFYRAYARDRKLRLEEPLAFAATHAEAELPFKPDRVFTGTLPGGTHGSLIVSGDGSKRSDRIAVVAGPNGPFAVAELESDKPVLSTEDLDVYAELLAGELAAAPAPA